MQEIYKQKFKSIFRIIDANINRCIEGIRVVEEYYRFIKNNKSAQKELKNLRHQIAATAADHFDYEHLLLNRNTEKDIGSDYSIASEKNKISAEQILKSNFKRCQESLRALEEYSKIVDSSISEKFKKLRFELYALEKKILLNQLKNGRLF